MAEQQQSIKVILDNIMRHPLLQDLTLETVVDYTINFMRLVGVPSMFQEKVVSIQIAAYRAVLPHDFYQVNQIRLTTSAGVPLSTFRYASDTFHMGGSIAQSSDYTYKIQGGGIYTSIETGTIELAYQAIETDNLGYPLIPDNSSFTRALEAFIKRQHFTILLDMGKISREAFNQVKEDYAWAVGDCQTEFNRLSLDKAESFYNSWRTLLIRPSEHRTGFINNGSKEQFKVH